MLKKYQEPLSDDQVFISTSTEQITWGELEANLDAKIEILKSHGIGPHVVFILASTRCFLD